MKLILEELDNGIIKQLFNEEYARYFKERHDEEATPEQITAVQGYYFARATSSEYTDNENLYSISPTF